MQKGTTFVGLDVHKESINVAMLLSGETRPVEWQTSNDPGGGPPPGEEASALAGPRRLFRASRASGSRRIAVGAQARRVAARGATDRGPPAHGGGRGGPGPIDTLTAMCLVAELHSFMRFESARGLMAYLA